MKRIILGFCAAISAFTFTSCMTPEALGLMVGTSIANKARKKVSSEVKSAMKTAVSDKVKSTVAESIVPPSIGVNSFKGKTFTATVNGINETLYFIDGTYVYITYEKDGKTWNGEYEYSHNQLNHTLYLSWAQYPVVINMMHEKAMTKEEISTFIDEYLTEENYKSKFMEAISNPEFREYVINYTSLSSDSTDEEFYEEYLCNKKTDLDLNRGASWGRFKATEAYEMNHFYSHEFRKIIEYKYDVQKNGTIELVRHIDKDDTIKYLFNNQKLPVLENFAEDDEYKFTIRDEILSIQEKATGRECQYFITEINSSKIRSIMLFEGPADKVFPKNLNIAYKEDGKGDKLKVNIKFCKKDYSLTWSKDPIVITQK